MTTICDGCVYAEWKRTTNGRLHPGKLGKCKWLAQHPLNLQIPQAFSWGGWGRRHPIPFGGIIERGKVHRDLCVFKEPAP